jgi:mono/diheme cytochrome c family protein
VQHRLVINCIGNRARAAVAGRAKLIKMAVLTLLSSFSLVSPGATQDRNRASRGEVPSAQFGAVVPLPSSKTLTAAQLAGKKLFVQRCSVCHLPALPSYTAYGPLLDRELVAARGDAAVRERIVEGSPRMPGWQYTLGPAEIDEIVGYLKTLHFATEAGK